MCAPPASEKLKLLKLRANKKTKLAKTKRNTHNRKLMIQVNKNHKLLILCQGKARVYVKTYGCSHNISDSEYMAGLLEEYGYTLVEQVDEADAFLINSCTVKNPSQEKFINLVGSAQKDGKPVVVSGCVP